jgi:hypothetical protein
MIPLLRFCSIAETALKVPKRIRITKIAQSKQKPPSCICMQDGGPTIFKKPPEILTYFQTT